MRLSIPRHPWVAGASARELSVAMKLGAESMSQTVVSDGCSAGALEGMDFACMGWGCDAFSRVGATRVEGIGSASSEEELSGSVSSGSGADSAGTSSSRLTARLPRRPVREGRVAVPSVETSPSGPTTR